MRTKLTAATLSFISMAFLLGCRGMNGKQVLSGSGGHASGLPGKNQLLKADASPPSTAASKPSPSAASGKTPVGVAKTEYVELFRVGQDSYGLEIKQLGPPAPLRSEWSDPGMVERIVREVHRELVLATPQPVD